MIEAMPGTPRLPWLCDAGACGAGRLRRRLRPGSGRARRNRRFHAAALLLGGQRDHGAGDAGHRLDDALGGGAQRLHLLGAGGRHGDREEHLAVGDEDVGEEPELDDVAGEIRAVDGPETLQDGFLGNCHLSNMMLPVASEIVQNAEITKPCPMP